MDRKIQGTPSSASKDTPREKMRGDGVDAEVNGGGGVVREHTGISDTWE